METSLPLSIVRPFITPFPPGKASSTVPDTTWKVLKTASLRHPSSDIFLSLLLILNKIKISFKL